MGAAVMVQMWKGRRALHICTMGKEVFLHRVCGKKFKPIDASGGSSLFAGKGSKVLTIYSLFRVPDIRRFLRVFRHCYRDVPAVRLQLDAEFQPTLFFAEHCRVLASLAHIAHHLAQRLLIHPPGREQRKRISDGHEYFYRFSGMRFLAWSKLDVSGMGIHQRPLFCSLTRAEKDQKENRTGRRKQDMVGLDGVAPDGSDLCARDDRMDILQGRQYHSGAFIHWRHFVRIVVYNP